VRKIVDSPNKQRNKIVRWNDCPVLEGLDIRCVAEVLIHPVIGNKNEKIRQIAIDDFRQFIKKAKYTYKVLGVFGRCFDEKLGGAIVRRDIEKFSDAEITFPPPKNDLFFS